MRFLARLLLTTLALLFAAWLVPGLSFSSNWAALAAALLLGFVNAIVRPILIILTLPVTLVTLGLFIFIVNAACLGLTAALVPGFQITGFWSALVGSLVVSVASWVLNGLLPSAATESSA